MAFWMAAGVTLAGGLTVLWGHEVLGPARHPRFAHLPMIFHRQAAAPRPEPTAPSPTEPTTGTLSATAER